MAEELKTVANETGLFAHLSTQVHGNTNEISNKKQNNKKLEDWTANAINSDDESKNYFKTEKERLTTGSKHEIGGSKPTNPVGQKPKDSKKRFNSTNLLSDLNNATSQDGNKALKKINRS